MVASPIPGMQAYSHANTIFFAVYGTKAGTANTGWYYPVFPSRVSGVGMDRITFSEYPGLVGFMPNVSPPSRLAASTAPTPYPRYAYNPHRAAVSNSKVMTSAEQFKLKNAFISIQRGTFTSKHCQKTYEDYLVYMKALNMQVT